MSSSKRSASSQSSKKRMESDVMKLLMSNHDVSLIDDCINRFYVMLHGPKDTPYEGGIWRVRVELPTEYPYKSPSIGFVNRIFHPNIDEISGSVCLDVINQTWSPMYELINVFEVFLPQLLLYPNASDPLNGEAASLYVNNKADFIKRVKDTVERFAQQKHIDAMEATGQSSQQASEGSDGEKKAKRTNGHAATNGNGTSETTNGGANGTAVDDDDDDGDDESDLEVMDSDSDEEVADTSLTL